MADSVGSQLAPQLHDLDERVRQLFADIAQGAWDATQALITGDPAPWERFVQQDEMVGVLQRDVERVVEGRFVRYPPMGSDFRYAVTMLRVVPELERSADLVEHIARRDYLRGDLSPPVLETLADMGWLASEMWRSTADAWAAVDAGAASRLRQRDDRMDRMTATLPDLLAGTGVPSRTAMELALVGRFYERLADHAVHIARRIRWLADGT